MEGLKLYIWRNVWCDHTCGVAFALAHSPEEARSLILKEMGYAECPPNEWPGNGLLDDPEVHEGAYGFGVFGGA